MGEAWTVDSFLVCAVVEMPGGVRNLGCNFDRECVLARTGVEKEAPDGCSTTARLFDAIAASEGDSCVRDCDAGDTTDASFGVDSILDAGREMAPTRDAGRGVDSVLDVGRGTEIRDVDFDADHGRDISRRRDTDGSFSFSLSLKDSLKELKKEDVRACAVDGTTADDDFPEECL